VSRQRSITLPGADGIARIGEIMRALRASPPPSVGGLAVLAFGDYQQRTRTDHEGRVSPISLPPSNMLTFELEGGSRIIARPSGTEPKIKFYFDLREPMEEGEPLSRAEARAETRLGELVAVFCTLAGVG
jgi:phosphomannomutase